MELHKGLLSGEHQRGKKAGTSRVRDSPLLLSGPLQQLPRLSQGISTKRSLGIREPTSRLNSTTVAPFSLGRCKRRRQGPALVGRWRRIGVIAVVMDTFTDIDIFKDLQEACSKRKVSVYILLDRASFPHFLKMCRNLGVDHEQEKLMRVRTISGNTYCTRSGVKIVGRVQEKFILVDGIRVTTGSYRQVPYFFSCPCLL
nr:uncharacterized protein LOC125622683 isoform X3 [Caretta caretta]